MALKGRTESRACVLGDCPHGERARTPAIRSGVGIDDVSRGPGGRPHHRSLHRVDGRSSGVCNMPMCWICRLDQRVAADVAVCTEDQVNRDYMVLNVELGLETPIVQPESRIPKLATACGLSHTCSTVLMSWRWRPSTMAWRTAGVRQGWLRAVCTVPFSVWAADDPGRRLQRPQTSPSKLCVVDITNCRILVPQLGSKH